MEGPTALLGHCRQVAPHFLGGEALTLPVRKTTPVSSS